MGCVSVFVFVYFILEVGEIGKRGVGVRGLFERCKS